MFQRIGGAAYKVGLENSIALASEFNNPQTAYKTIHVAGTNGKGSVSHLIATILQLNGYKVGLYTSPHLVDFRERIRVNGKMIPKDKVTDFINRYEEMHTVLHPSFFELTMMMAFDHFKNEAVDVAVIEVGLGGRLDSTNIINPDLSIITNISFDHTQFLGNTLAEIASEKAGIIKKNIPSVIGETTTETYPVFKNKASAIGSPITFAEENQLVMDPHINDDGNLIFNTHNYGEILGELAGDCQVKNANTVLNTVEMLKSIGYTISNRSVNKAFATVNELSGLMGRWMKLSDSPRTYCDTGHNVGGITYIAQQLKRINCDRLHIVIGFVNDKDITHILDLLPKDATYYFTQANIPRAMPSVKVKEIASTKCLNGNSYNTVIHAYKEACDNASKSDFIYVGGSTFIVADLLSALEISR